MTIKLLVAEQSGTLYPICYSSNEVKLRTFRKKIEASPQLKASLGFFPEDYLTVLTIPNVEMLD